MAGAPTAAVAAHELIKYKCLVVEQSAASRLGMLSVFKTFHRLTLLTILWLSCSTRKCCSIAQNNHYAAESSGDSRASSPHGLYLSQARPTKLTLGPGTTILSCWGLCPLAPASTAVTRILGTSDRFGACGEATNKSRAGHKMCAHVCTFPELCYAGGPRAGAPWF